MSDKKALIVYQDEEPSVADPRQNDNLGTMICLHRRYRLGDPHGENVAEGARTPEEVEAFIDEHGLRDGSGGILHELYLYDHSGLVMRMDRGFSDIDSQHWDWGQIGYMYVLNERIKEEYGVVNQDSLSRAEAVLRAEFEEYNNWLRNNVFAYIIVDLDDYNNIITIGDDDADSCGGGYIAGSAEEAARDMLDMLGQDECDRIEDRVYFVDNLHDVLPKRKITESLKIAPAAEIG